MELNKFSETYGRLILEEENHKQGLSSGSVDLNRAKHIKVTRDTYLEAQEKGLTLSELLETQEYDPSPPGAQLDAFERQLASAGIKINGSGAASVEMFYRSTPHLMPEFILREIRKGMSLHPDLQKLVASSTMINSNRYTPFFIETSTGDNRWSLRPIGDGADIPEVVVNEQKHTVTVPDYGVNLKVTYKALRQRSTTQFKVLLWFLGYRLQADKNGLLINTVINGDGNSNPAIVHNTAVSGALDYTDLVNFYSEFYPFEMKLFLVHKDMLARLLTMEVFKDPLAGFTFQRTGEIVSPLGSKLVRCDEIPPDMIIGMDNRFAMEEVIGQPLSVEYDKIIEQRIEEAVISESVAFTKIVHEAARILDTEWGEVK